MVISISSGNEFKGHRYASKSAYLSSILSTLDFPICSIIMNTQVRATPTIRTVAKMVVPTLDRVAAELLGLIVDTLPSEQQVFSHT